MAARAASSCCRVAAARRFLLARKKKALEAGTRKKLAGAKQKQGMPTSRRRRLEVIRRKIRALRTLVPRASNGELQDRQDRHSRLDELLLHSADYILRLQMQVQVMQFMVHVLNPKD